MRCFLLGMCGRFFWSRGLGEGAGGEGVGVSENWHGSMGCLS